MKRNLATRSLHTRNRLAQPRQPSLSDPNELKSLVRDGLVSMNMAEREEFIQTLETEMRRNSLNMRAYLVPLGIPGRSPEDLTPTEVGHLIRFFSLDLTNTCWTRSFYSSEGTVLVLWQVNDLELEQAEPVLRAICSSFQVDTD